MLRLLRPSFLLLLLILAVISSSCGGATSTDPEQGATGTVPNLPPVPAAQPGVHMPELKGETFDLGQYDKGTSAAYNIYFRDSVNESSGPRWSSLNHSGKKAWVLSNTSYSAPKAWLLGGNYWNNENDDLFSNQFTVTSGTDGLALTFYARWNVVSNDNATVEFWDGQAYQQVISHDGDSNPSYPGWDKFYYKLPKNTSGSDQDCFLVFHLDSDNDGFNAFGFGVDNVAVYQTQLAAADSVAATDGTVSGEIDLSWNYTPQGNLTPESYNIYRAPDSNGAPGTFAYLDNVSYGTNTYADTTATDGTPYWYSVNAVKAGWPVGPNSNYDQGHAQGTWQLVPVESTGVKGQYSSMTVLNGKPVMAYYDGDNQDLKFAYTAQADGSSGWTPVTADSTGSTGFFTSVADINGKPGIAYFDSTNGDVRYAYSSQADGSSGWSSVQVDGAAAFVGQYCRLANVNGKPAISYIDGTNGALKYAYSSQADGSSGWTAITVDNTVTVSNDTSIAVINGKPAISYYDSANGNLKYAYSSQADGSSGWTAITVDSSADDVGTYSSLADVNGFPAISYYDGTTQDLLYAYSSQADGSSGWSSTTVESTGIVGTYTSLTVVYGKPAISYTYFTGGFTADLRFAVSSTTDGSSGWTSVDVDNGPGNSGTYTSTAVLASGKPAIGYSDADNGDARFAYYQ